MSEQATVCSFRYRDQSVEGLALLALLQAMQEHQDTFVSALEEAKAQAVRGNGYAAAKAIHAAELTIKHDLLASLTDAYALADTMSAASVSTEPEDAA